MPFLLRHPNATFPITLASDADIPEPNRPAFICRFIAADDNLAQEEKLSTLDELPERDAFNQALDAILISVVGWENVNNTDGTPLAFSREAMFVALTPQELCELAVKCRSEPYEARKRFEKVKAA